MCNEILKRIKNAISDKTMSPTAKLIYIYFLVWNDEEKLKPRTKMAYELSITNITLGKYLGELCEKGYVFRTQTRKEGKFGICSYTILK